MEHHTTASVSEPPVTAGYGTASPRALAIAAAVLVAVGILLVWTFAVLLG